MAVSQLEVAVLAFSVCAFVTYCLNWTKLQGVETATENPVSSNLANFKDYKDKQKGP